ncbi:major facilitator superfamily domain-containing protein [Xylariomycetidae sp. FL0641]|nr:major facilitator superfamily domain-containing protein [Xylariomycetidae sp. FL0641]
MATPTNSSVPSKVDLPSETFEQSSSQDGASSEQGHVLDGLQVEETKLPSSRELSPTQAGSDEANTIHGFPLIMFSAGMMAVVFLMCLDHYILATAIPRITTDLNSLPDAAWYSSGYFLTNMALQPAFGQIYKFFSVRLVYLACVVVFEAGSVICALAPSSAVLIIGRIITGIGGGGLYIGSVVLVGYAIPVQRRPVYISIVTSLDGVASFVGPLLGGVLTDSHLTWRFCFWINLPIGFVAFVILWCYLRDPPEQSLPGGESSPILHRLATQVDWLSMVLLLGGFTLVLIALQWGGVVYRWSDARVYGCLTGGGITLAIYFFYQHYQGERAAIPYRLLGQRSVFFSSGFMLLINIVIGALVYYLPFEFQAVRGADARASGIDNLAFLVPLMLSPLVSGLAISRLGWYVPFMYVGGMLATAGTGLLTSIGGETSTARLNSYQFIAGFGSGICHQIPYTSILHFVSTDDVVPGSALCSFLNSLGAIVGIVISQAIFSNTLTHNLESVAGIDAGTVVQAGPTGINTVVPPSLVATVRAAYGDALQATYYLPVAAAGLCIICALGMEWKRLKH